MNWRCSRCTDWKFYTWFHLYSTNGYIIAPFHHFPSLGDIKGSSLRELRNGEHIRQEIWKMLRSDHAYFYLSLSWEGGEKKPSLIELGFLWGNVALVFLLKCTSAADFTDCFLFSSLKRNLTSSPGQFPSIKNAPALELQMVNVRPEQISGSPGQLLWHVRHAGMPCHSPLLRCNKG